MTTNSNVHDDDVLQDDIRQAFHSWKKEDLVSKLFFRYLQKEIDQAHKDVINFAFANVPSDEKLKTYHILSAKIQFYQELIDLSLDDLTYKLAEPKGE